MTRYVLALSLVFSLAPRVAGQARPTVFRTSSKTVPPPEHLWNRGVRRVRPVELEMPLFDRAAVKQFASAKRRRSAAPVVDMNFFPDTSLHVVWKDVGQTDDLKGFVWSGIVEGAPTSSAVFVVTGNLITANVARGDGLTYQVRTSDDGAIWVRELDQSQFRDELPPVVEPAPFVSQAPPDAAATAADDGSVIDVMVVYTPVARQMAGGTDAMQRLIQLGIAETNQGYSNSGVIQRVRLVYSGEVNYTESGAFNTDLSRLRNPSDGYMDEVPRLRDSYGADVVSLWVESGDACGLGYLMGDPTRPNPDAAYSVVERSCATGYYSFGHEMGHNMGAMHARDDGTGPGAYPYSYGYKVTTGPNKFRTVMAYDTNCSCTRVNYWSNANIAVSGVPAGIDPNASGAATNYLTLNNTRTIVANYRTNPAAAGPAGNGLPESDHPYANNTDKTYTYTLPGGAASLNVTFDSRTSVEPGYDFLYVSDASGTQIQGSPFTGNALAGKTIVVPGATVKIRLVSDDNIVDYGFRLTGITGNSVGAGAPLPRLVITSFTTPTTGAIGASLIGTRTAISNSGAAATSAFRIGYYFSRNRTVTTADLFSGIFCTFNPGIAAGASSSCSGDLAVPSTLSPGIWYVAAIADDQNQVQQSDRSANIRVADTGPLTITGGSAAELVSPASGSILTSNTATFQWTPGSGVTLYSLAIGTTPGGTDIYKLDQGTNLSVTITGLPTNGATLYIKLTSRIGTDVRVNSYIVRAASLGSGGSLPRLVISSFTSPTSGTVGVNLSGINATISNQGTAPTGPFRIGYYYSRNPAVTTADIYSGWACGISEGLAPGASTTCGGDLGVPSTLSSGVWYLAAIADDQHQVQQSDASGAIRIADTGPITLSGRAGADLTTPTPGSTLTSDTVTFRWNTGSTPDEYFLAIGTTPGGADLYNQSQSQNLSVRVSGLPVNGRTIYVRLSSRFGSDLVFNDYTFRAFNAGAGGTGPRLVINSFTAPTRGSIGGNLSGTSLTVVNQGNANAGAFGIGYYFSKNPNVTTADIFSGWFCAVGSLATGNSFTCSGDIGVPTNLTPGVWYLAAIADDQSQLQQLDRAGSTRVMDNGPVTLTGGGQTGGALPESDHPYANNTDKSWTYTLAGNPSAISVTFNALTSVEDGYDFILVYDGTGKQIPGSPFTGTALASRSIVVPGATVRIRLLSDESVTDYGFRVIAVKPAGALPKLVITSFSAPTTGVIGGTLAGTKLIVQNQGTAKASGFEVGYYLSQNPNVTTDDVWTGWYCGPIDLDPGATYTCGGAIGSPPTLTPGRWYLAAIADDEYLVDQLDRSGATRVSDNGPITFGFALDPSGKHENAPQPSAARDYKNSTDRASFTAGFSRSCASTSSGTAPSVATTATASNGSPGLRGASRRPSEKFAMLTLLRPITPPTYPITPGTSRFFMKVKCPESGTSQ